MAHRDRNLAMGQMAAVLVAAVPMAVAATYCSSSHQISESHRQPHRLDSEHGAMLSGLSLWAGNLVAGQITAINTDDAHLTAKFLAHWAAL